MIEAYPAFVRAYDLLYRGDTDVRGEAFIDRRAMLAEMVDGADPTRFDLSPLVPFADWETLDRIRLAPPDPVIEGVMIKRRDSVYSRGGRRARGGSEARSLQHRCRADVMPSAATASARASIPTSPSASGRRARGATSWCRSGKAYFGFTDAELLVLDKFGAQQHHRALRPGALHPREADFGFVVEVAFRRHQPLRPPQSGVAMRFPRIARLREDKLPATPTGWRHWWR